MVAVNRNASSHAVILRSRVFCLNLSDGDAGSLLQQRKARSAVFFAGMEDRPGRAALS
ncbi:hypothetical protein [Paracoccus sp. IB05]|uniref:hypothetical protein n=1 Tax=Paracoccus sp. IB05 TaxID=2779367 RepID=UPI00351C2E75